MEDVDENEGKFKQIQVKAFEEVKRGYTYFEENDVLYAKITPSMENGKTAIARGLIDGFGFGTTEFHVFRPTYGILPEYLHYFIRRVPFRLEAKQHFRGAVGQQRVPKDFLITYPFPVPYPNEPERSLDVQRRIVARIEALLAEVREMRKLHDEITADTDSFMEAVLAETFPSLERPLPEGWILKKVKDIAQKPQYGLTQSAKSEPVGPRFLRITDIQNGRVNWSEVPYCECDSDCLEKYRLISGDIVFARSGATTGKTFLVKDPPEESVFASYLIRLKLREQEPEYVAWFFQSPDYWRQITPVGAAIPNMNATLLQEVKLPVPVSKNQQMQIVHHLDLIRSEVEEMRKTNENDLGLLAELEQAILSQAFRGEL